MLTGTELYAVDCDPAAVRCARRNLPAAGTVCQGDLFDALPRDLRGRVDLLVVNAPYVPTGELDLLPAEARDHEPRWRSTAAPTGWTSSAGWSPRRRAGSYPAGTC